MKTVVITVQEIVRRVVIERLLRGADVLLTRLRVVKKTYCPRCGAEESSVEFEHYPDEDAFRHFCAPYPYGCVVVRFAQKPLLKRWREWIGRAFSQRSRIATTEIATAECQRFGFLPTDPHVTVQVREYESSGDEQAATHWENAPRRVESGLAAQLRTVNETISAANLLRALDQSTDSDLAVLLDVTPCAGELAVIRSLVHARLKLDESERKAVSE